LKVLGVGRRGGFLNAIVATMEAEEPVFTRGFPLRAAVP
jgi:hypothetical protein